MSNEIQKLEPPALPLPPQEYSRLFHDQKDNVFRLFFNRLTSLLSNLLDVNSGGRFLYYPSAVFYSTQTQEAAASNTAYVVTYNNTHISRTISLIDGSKLSVGADGVYGFAFSAQVDKHGGSTRQFYLWIRKNGVDVDNSCQEYGFDHPTSAKWSFNIDMKAGDYIEMVWAASNTDVDLHYYAPSAPRPAIPSAVVSLSFISND